MQLLRNRIIIKGANKLLMETNSGNLIVESNHPLIYFVLKPRSFSHSSGSRSVFDGNGSIAFLVLDICDWW